jgi:hypothetical protein
MSYHDDVAISRAQHQNDHKAAASDADHKTADINHYKRLLAAGHTWGVKNGAYQALINLGQSLQPLGGEV